MELAADIGPIEKGLPILRDGPIKRGRPKGHFSLVGKIIRALQVGDSRLFMTEAEKECARTAARYAGIKILVRKSPEGGWRIWRKE